MSEPDIDRFAPQDLTRNAFLGGRLLLDQPRQGYRAGIDPVLLAASVPARAGQAVLDLGCGAGAAVLCLGARVGGLDLTGIELQSAYADLARRNAGLNDLSISVFCADLSMLPQDLRNRQFDHVLANPPYYPPGAHSPARDSGRQVALGGATPLENWVSCAARRLRTGGFLHVVQRVERLPELLAACGGQLGSIEVLPLSPRAGRPPRLILMRARKGGRAGFRLLAPLTLHDGARHERDGDSYLPEINNVLRNGAALSWPD